jgi:hypothetical protein
MRHRAERAAFDQDRLFVQDLGRLQDLAGRGEHGGVGQAGVDQFQAHQTVVDIGERRAGEVDHIHLDPLDRKAVQ